MPYYLNNASDGTASVNIPSVVIGSTVGDYIEIKAVANSGNTNGYELYGRSDTISDSNRLVLFPASAILRANSSSNAIFSTGYTQPSVGVVFIAKLVKVGSSTWELFIDGSSKGVVSSGAFLTLTAIAKRVSNSTTAFRGGIYYVNISTDGGATSSRYYDANASGGSGTVLPDTINSANNGTLSGGWSWVFYSSGGTYTLTADGATFSYMGAAANTLFNRQLSSDGATYSYSGGAASTLYNRRLSADGAVYAYIGGAASTLYNRRLPADGGAYSYSGAAATLTYTAAGVVYTLNADGAVFGYTGSAASLLANRALSADGGSFTYSDGNAEFDFNGYPQADANAYVVSYRIAGDTVLTASISDSARFSAIISQSTTVRYMVN